MVYVLEVFSLLGKVYKPGFKVILHSENGIITFDHKYELGTKLNLSF